MNKYKNMKKEYYTKAHYYKIKEKWKRIGEGFNLISKNLKQQKKI